MSWPCAGCGGDNPDGTRFCGHCGTPRPAASAETPAPDLQPAVADLAEVFSSALAGQRAQPDRGDVVNRPHTERLASARAGVEERRLITAVFADVSGFTALAHGLDAEQLVGIIGPIVSRLADIVTRYGGYVGKFAGDAILAFFGAPVAHEDDAVRALLAAGDMQRESAELFASLGPEASGLTLHVGVNTGYVVAGFFGDQVRMEYSVLGDAVNVAQRLESAAPGGAVYVGNDTYMLAGSRFAFEDLGGIQVKGKPEPIRCWRLLGEASGGVGASRATPATRLVGRSRELAALAGVLAPRKETGGGVAAVVGEPGTGKSALIQEAMWRIAESGAQWVETHCVDYRSRPYRPYVELLRVLTEIPEDVEPAIAGARVVEEARRTGVPDAAAYFLTLLGLPASPELPDTTPSDPQAFRQGLHDAVAAYLVVRAAVEPLVLGIEDVHWADPGTVDLTSHLIRRTSTAPFSVVVTARPEGRDVAASLATATERSAVVDLGPLDRDAIAELAADVVDGTAAPGLVDLVAERTSGNPLFAQQLLRSLVDMDALEADGGGWRLRRGWNADSVPTAVEQVLAARIDLLPRPAADLLQVAAVIGRTVLPALLRRVAGGPEHDGAVGLLVRGGFLQTVEEGGDTRLWFHHALLVDVAYGRLLRARRRDIHRDLVAAIVDMYGSGDDVVDMLARHAHGGEMGRTAVDYLERAGARAEAMFANQQAVGYLRQAIEIAEGDARDRLAPLLLRCAGVEETRGAYPEALELYRRAEAEGTGLRAQLGQAATLRKLGDYPGGLAVVAAARAAHPALSAEDEGLLAFEEAWILALQSRHRDATALYRAGLAAAARAGDRLLEARLLVGLARSSTNIEGDDTAASNARRARDLFEAEGSLPGLATALRVLGGIESELAGDSRSRMEEAVATLERAREIAVRVGNAEEEGASLINLSTVLADLGRVEEAMRRAGEAIEVFSRVGLRAGVACGYCNLADQLIDAGRNAEAREKARIGLAVATEIGHGFWITGGLLGIAGASLALGDHAEAARCGEEAFDRAVDWSFNGRAVSALRATLKAMHVLGDRDGEARMRAKALAAGIELEAALSD